MKRMYRALQGLKTENPMRLPLRPTGENLMPVRGTTISAGLAYEVTDRMIEDFVAGIVRHPKLKSLENARYRVVQIIPEMTFDRNGLPVTPGAYRLQIYNYDRNEPLEVMADFPRARNVEVKRMEHQPESSWEEHLHAVEIVRQHPKFGEPLRTGRATTSRGMPSVLDYVAEPGVKRRFDAMPIGGKPPVNRTVSVIVHFNDAGIMSGNPDHAVYWVDLVNNTVDFGDAFIMACGAPSSACGSNGRGLAGNIWIDWPTGNPVWRINTSRPSASSGGSGSGIEIFSVDYMGKRVLKRGGLPVLNVYYDGNACGPYRDWMYNENCITATGTDLGPGYRWSNNPSTNICDVRNDAGNFTGVGVYESGNELVMMCECSAGWYRYIMEWRFHRDGIIRPRFKYGYTMQSCVCSGRTHHAYWRLDFDLNGAADHVVEEIDNPTRDPRARWDLIRMESKRLRRPGVDRRWRVRNTASGEVAEIIPNEKDGYTNWPGTSPVDYGKGDLWVLRYAGNGTTDQQIDDSGTGQSGTHIKIDSFANRESTVNQNLVVWYGVHLRKTGSATYPDDWDCPPLGPDIVLKNW